ncbi:hypothetical protein Rhow_004078 [Rhodococcus wratislaviensis]|uniref:Uncharacterized protein n=1 Tax=Rhodococcus wratislaviensis TaxID=44752 RepID=A0A402C9Y8_RHOWR|nr:hypothetical protein Rhow_004078 [Rhodococcus wratislaviensis]
MEHVPRVEAEAGGDHHGHREAVQPQSGEQCDQAATSMTTSLSSTTRS